MQTAVRQFRLPALALRLAVSSYAVLVAGSQARLSASNSSIARCAHWHCKFAIDHLPDLDKSAARGWCSSHGLGGRSKRPPASDPQPMPGAGTGSSTRDLGPPCLFLADLGPCVPARSGMGWEESKYIPRNLTLKLYVCAFDSFEKMHSTASGPARLRESARARHLHVSIVYISRT